MKAGDPHATAEVLRLADAGLQRMARRAARSSRSDADDFAQEARLVVLDLLGTWRPEAGPFAPYLYSLLPARLRDTHQVDAIRLPTNVAGALRVLRASETAGQEIDRTDLCRRWAISMAQLRAADQVDADPSAAFRASYEVGEEGFSGLDGLLAGRLNEGDQAYVMAVACDGLDAVAAAEGIQRRAAKHRFQAALRRASGPISAA